MPFKEPVCNGKEDPDALVLDAVDTEFIPREDVKRNPEEKFGLFDEGKYYKETECDRREKQ